MHKKFLFFLIFLIFLVPNLFSEQLNLNLTFEKENYSGVVGDSLRITYTIENLSPEKAQFKIISVCDETRTSCDFSDNLSLLGNSTLKGSFLVSMIDDGYSTLKLFIKNKNFEKEFPLRLTVEKYNDRGYFEIDLSKTNFCENTFEEIYLDFERVSKPDFYNISVSSDTLNTYIKGGSTRQLKKNLSIPLHIETFDVSKGNHKLTLYISDQEILSKKTFDIYVSECQVVYQPEFIVSSAMRSNHTIFKEKEYVLEYTVKNISTKYKDLFIAEDLDLNHPLDINFSNRELRLAPGQSKTLSFSFYASKDVLSGTYPVNLLFFDERTTITKQLKFSVSPESYLNAYLYQNSVLLEVNKFTSIFLVIENKGDFIETLYFNTFLSNDLSIQALPDKLTVYPNSKETIVFDVVAGKNSEEIKSQILLQLNNQRDTFSELFTINVNVFSPTTFFKIELLSFPKEILLDVNEDYKPFSFEVYNYGDKPVVLEKIEIIGLENTGIRYNVSQNITIPSSSSKIISGFFSTTDANKGNTYSVNLVIYDDEGHIFSKPFVIKVNEEEDYKVKDKTPLTGFFTLGKSILLGLIFLFLLLIVLFATGVIKTKHKNYTKY